MYRFEIVLDRPSGWLFRLENGRRLFEHPTKEEVVNVATYFLKTNGGVLKIECDGGGWGEEIIFSEAFFDGDGHAASTNETPPGSRSA